MKRCFCVLLLFSCLTLFTSSVQAEKAKKQRVRLEEGSAFELGKGEAIAQGTYTSRMPGPEPAVRYPNLKSSKPIYGFLPAGGDFTKQETITKFWYVLDEGRGTDTGHDVMYLDLNADGDLTNDGPLHVLASPPKGASASDVTATQTYFDMVTLKCKRQNGKPSSVEVLPVLTTHQRGTFVRFVPTKAYQGRVKIGKLEFDVCVGRQHYLSGGLDEPSAGVYVKPKDVRGDSWWGNDSPKAFHKVYDTFYQFKPDWNGKRLSVLPYKGDLGTFEAGAGGREGIKRVVAYGSLSGKDGNVAVGMLFHNDHVPSKTCTVPAGDYYPAMLDVTMDDTVISVSNNYYSDGKLRGSGKDVVHGIQIRKDKPFVLDFSNKPEVIFPAPAPDARIKVGTTLQAVAVLIDPKLDIMIRRIRNGDKGDYEGPKVRITRANGEQVAEGVMPFG